MRLNIEMHSCIHDEVCVCFVGGPGEFLLSDFESIDSVCVECSSYIEV